MRQRYRERMHVSGGNPLGGHHCHYLGSGGLVALAAGLIARPAAGDVPEVEAGPGSDRRTVRRRRRLSSNGGAAPAGGAAAALFAEHT